MGTYGKYAVTEQAALEAYYDDVNPLLSSSPPETKIFYEKLGKRCLLMLQHVRAIEELSEPPPGKSRAERLLSLSGEPKPTELPPGYVREDDTTGYKCWSCSEVCSTRAARASHAHLKHDWQHPDRIAVQTNQCPYWLKMFSCVTSAAVHYTTWMCLKPNYSSRGPAWSAGSIYDEVCKKRGHPSKKH